MALNDNIDERCCGARGNQMPTVTPLPIDVVGAEGNSVILQDGTKLLDLWTDVGVNSLGYNSEIIADVLALFSSHPIHLSSMYPCDVRLDMIHKLANAAGFNRVF